VRRRTTEPQCAEVAHRIHGSRWVLATGCPDTRHAAAAYVAGIRAGREAGGGVEVDSGLALPSCAFMGTVVQDGSGLGVVTGTSGGTAFGTIAMRLGERQPETALEIGCRGPGSSGGTAERRCSARGWTCPWTGQLRQGRGSRSPSSAIRPRASLGNAHVDAPALAKNHSSRLSARLQSTQDR
jgi:hypothetical protein